MVDDQEQRYFELSLEMKGSVNQRLYKNGRKYTRFFQNPANGHYYIFLKPNSWVSNELRNVVDCYIMQTANFGKSIQVIVEDKIIDVNNKSDAEDND